MADMKTILLVEDETIIAWSEQTILEKYGFHVITAETGEKAIEETDKNPDLDLILMDINLGRGLEGTEAAKQILKKRDLPLIFLSSHTKPSVVEKTEGITSYGYIVKDSGETVLIASIKMAFRLFEAKMQARDKEKALQDREQKYHGMIQNLMEGFYTVTLDGKLLEYNTEFTRMLKLDPQKDHRGIMIPDFWQHPKEREVYLADIKKKGFTKNYEVKAQKSDGEPIDIIVNSRIITDEQGNAGSIEGLILDITERKRAEEALRISEDRLSKIMLAANDGMWDWDLKSNRVYFDPRYYRMAEYEVDEFPHRLEEFQKRVHPEDLEYVMKEAEKHLSGLIDRFIVEFRFRKKSGAWLWVQGHGIIVERDANGVPLRFVGTQRDITERKKAEIETRLNHNMLARTERIAEIGSWEWDIDNDRVKWSDELFRIFQRDPAGGAPSFAMHDDLYVAEDMARLKKAVECCQTEGTPYELELRAIRTDGEIRYCISRGRAEPDSEGRIHRLVGSLQDITERKEAEGKLRQSLSLLNATLESTADGILVVDLNGKAVSFNRKFLKMWRIPHSVADTRDDKTLLAHIQNQLEQPEVFFDKVKRLYSEPESSSRDNITFKDGRIFERYSQPQQLDGQIVGRVWSFRDVTETRKAQEKIIALLEEKELILKEAHHQIKNHMWVVRSLLTLQASAIENPDARRILTEAANRVESMVLLYDKLHRSEGFLRLSLKKFLPALVDTIVGLFDTDPPVQTQIDVEDIVLDARTLSCIGIIFNECITNSMKHAFKNTQNGRIGVSASKSGSVVTLTYADNGPGLPESADFKKSTGFGMKLIHMLVQQIGGRIRIEKDGRTKYIIEIIGQ
ncbi:MAG TPA: response regulator [bacterium]|nr:response regulator [bacterium]